MIHRRVYPRRIADELSAEAREHILTALSNLKYAQCILAGVVVKGKVRPASWGMHSIEFELREVLKALDQPMDLKPEARRKLRQVVRQTKRGIRR